jgi:hypothetical protein
MIDWVRNPLGPQLVGGGQQVGGALAAQPVGQGHAAVPGRGLAQGGELVDDGVGPAALHRPHQAVAVQGVGHHRLGPEGLQPAGPGLVAGEAEHPVAAGDELAGEGHPEGAAGPGDQDLHDFLPCR